LVYKIGSYLHNVVLCWPW